MAKAVKGTAREPEVLDALQQEVALVKADSSLVEQFAAKLGAFFTTARALEVKAKNNLLAAKALTLPTTRDEDEALQFTIKRFGADKKEAVDLWDITQKVSQFHKRLVGARKRSEEPNEQAVAIGTQLHNEFVANENRRVAAENERRRIEAENKAKADRAAELAELDRQAVAAEEASKDLSEREGAFVRFYMRTGNAIDAAQAAGYKDFAKQAPRLLSLDKIMAACDAQKKAEVLREQAAAVAEKPLDVQVETVTADISKAGGHDRATHSAELLDERLLIEAILGGRHGIPTDLLTINPAKLNEYARSIREHINKWPGVRYKKSTSLV